MKSLTDIVKSCTNDGAGALVGSDGPRAKDQPGPAAGHVERAAQKSLWQDVEFVP